MESRNRIKARDRFGSLEHLTQNRNTEVIEMAETTYREYRKMGQCNCSQGVIHGTPKALKIFRGIFQVKTTSKSY